MMQWTAFILPFTMIAMLAGCTTSETDKKPALHRIVTLDPGHFHASLVQKTMPANVDSTSWIYAPEGPDLDLHLARIQAFNSRTVDPTYWNLKVYTGPDFLEKAMRDKQGDILVLSGNNKRKADYVLASVKSGFNVLCDKPMVIDRKGFETLRDAFDNAQTNGVLLYDLMTERFEITTILQKELSQVQEIFGDLEEGNAEDPSVTKESVHHFYKYVSGNVLVRPPWFFDAEQEGEGLVDVMTHLVDLVQWECFPAVIIDPATDMEIISAKRWPTEISADMFREVTGLQEIPDYLKKIIKNDSILEVFCNGEINYRLKGIHAKTSVTWVYRSAEGGGDTHYSLMRGTKASLVIRQGADQGFRPELYIEPAETDGDYLLSLKENSEYWPKSTLGSHFQSGTGIGRL